MSTGNAFLTGKTENQLFAQWWQPENPKAVVAIVHGYAEHSGRYAHVAETFVAHGYAVYAYDHRSHGQSDGENAFISSFDDVVDELELFLAHIAPQIGDLPTFVLGHSMGGLIVSLFLASRKPQLTGAALSGPYLEVNADVPRWLVGVSGIVGKCLPRLPTIELDYKDVSRDQEMLARHQADPLMYRGKLLARTGAEMNRGIQKLKGSMEQITTPLLVMHGGDDRIAPVNGSKVLYERVRSTDKRIKIYDNLYHEILNEYERAEVKEDIVAWMDERCAHVG